MGLPRGLRYGDAAVLDGPGEGGLDPVENQGQLDVERLSREVRLLDAALEVAFAEPG